MELEQYNIKESEDFKSLLEAGCNKEKYEVAADNTYNIINKKLKSNLEIVSFPSETELMALVKDTYGNTVLVSMRSYFKMMASKSMPKATVLDISPILKMEEFEQEIFRMFNYSGVSDEEKVNKKLLWLCKIADKLQSSSVYKGVTSDYKRMLATEYMNDFSYGLYTKFNLDLSMICRILTTRQTYCNLDKAIEVIVAGEAIRKVGEDCELYNKVPKYMFVSTFIEKNMTVNEIIRVFSKGKKHLIHKSKLDEFIKGRDAMVDFKSSNNPIMSVVFLDELKNKENF